MTAKFSAPNRAIMLAVAAILQAAAARQADAGPLPTPCAGGACGVHAGNLPFVQSGTAGATIAGKNLTVNQTSTAAILNWKDFDIAAGNSVNFVQPSSTASTLNRIWSGQPSTIAGQLTANGQVYLINQNGIVFANGAQVNVGGLTASTLDIPDAVYKNGILSANTDAIKQAGQLGVAFQASSTGTTGGVTVEQGATLTTSDGGRVMLLGTTVKNSGTINTPDGQTIMGAGTTVYLASTTDPSMRGLLIAVDGQQLAANSTATNEGTITAARGNVTIAGLVVNQSGTINATTSVNANGSIYLVAGNVDTSDPNAQFYNKDVTGFAKGQLAPNVGGTLNLNTGSVTQVTADTTDKGTVTDTQVFNRSQIELVGQTVIANNGAKVIAPGGQIDIDAAANPFNYVLRLQQHRLAVASDGGQIYLDSGSTIDASGLQNVEVDASRNLIQIQLGLNELQDDPLLRDGFLHGQTVTVDVGKGTPLLNAATLQSYANTIGRGVQEKLSTGGTISLNAGGDVITRAGSVQNVSGGSIAYQSSPGATSKLIGIDGKVYDISDAQPNLQYIAFQNSYSYTDQRWGTTTSLAQSSGQISGYQQGADAGELNIRAPQSFLRGQMLATTTPGPYQRSASAGIASSLPKGGTLLLGDANATADSNNVTNNDAPSVVFRDNLTDDLGTYEPPGTIPVALPTADLGVSALSPAALAKGGFNNIAVYSNGTVTIAADSPVDLAGGGSLSIHAGSVAIDGSIHIPGGSVAVATQFLSNPTSALADDSNITLAPGAVIDVRGTWVNDSPLLGNEQPTAPTLYNGGSVSLQTAAVNVPDTKLHNDIVLGAGSLIDVSGGGWVTDHNTVVAGTGGDITLQVGAPSGRAATGGVQLGGTLLGESLSNGGRLSITSALVSVDNGVTGQQGQLALTGNFFTSNGFRSYSITGINGVTIGSGDPLQTSAIQPIQQNLIFTESALRQVTGSDLRDFTRVGLLPDYQRKPTTLSFAATGSSLSGPGFGSLVFNAGASILTDPGAGVSLTARNNLTFLGKIEAPAGDISLRIAPGGIAASTVLDDDGYLPAQQLLIGKTAQLLAPGYAAVYTNNAKGYRTGAVLDGGNITIQAYKGSVVAQSGSLIDVSGTSAVVDVINTRGVTPTTVAGNAGSVDIEARENIVLNGTLAGAAAPVSGAAGGSLTVGLSLFDLTATNTYNAAVVGGAYPTNNRNLTITAGKVPAGDSLPLDDNGIPLSGTATISVNELTSGGFDNLALKSADIVTLDGALSLSARGSISINAPQLAAAAGARATISAPYVALGYANYDAPLSGESGRLNVPTTGNGLLAVTANQIDVIGHSVLSGFGSVALVSSGDMRLTYGINGTRTDFAGSLASTGHLTLQAAQIYPTTATAFTLNPTDLGPDPTQSTSYSYVPGQVTILPGTSSGTVPLSALGTLTINGSGIDQYGTLRAPLGQIALNVVGSDSVLELHAGSLTSVSADGMTIPFGSTQNSTQWTYPIDSSQGSTRAVTTLPRKQVSLNGSVVKTDSQSTVDLSGGGDLYAYEFVAGTGGSQDVLNPGGSYSYAILPGLGSQYAPVDYQYSTGTNISAGREIYLTGVPGLADGYYALLPAHYALLPGAYAIQMTASSSDIAAGAAVKQPDGSYLTAGRFAVAGTGILDSRTSSFIVAPGSVVRSESQYIETTANQFFYAAAAAAAQAAATGTAITVNLPADAGQLDLISSGTMELKGKIDFAAAQFVSGKDANGKDILQSGTGGIAAIEAQQIEVVSTGAASDGALQLTADSLNALGASTLILGGRRSDTDGTAELTVSANTVTLKNSAADPLKGTNIILAATGQVDLEPRSAIAADSASTTSTPLALHVDGDGALLAVGSGNPITVLRTNVPSTPVALLNIAAGASVTGGNLTLDSAGDTVVATDASLTAKRVTASSSHVSLGDVPANTTGLNLTTDLLANLKGLTDLSLHSDSTIDFYNTVQLGSLDSTGAPVLESITLDAKGLGGYGAGTKTLQAGIISLTNVSGVDAPFTTVPDGTGSLSLVALASGQKGSGQLNLGAGSKYLAGFGGVGLTATGDIRAQDSGSLNLAGAGNLALQSAHISTDSGATQKVSNTTGSVTLTASSDTGIAPAPGVGGSLTFEGTTPAGSAAIVQNGLIELPAGVLNLHAIGSGDIVLGSGSRIDATGVVQQFADTYGAASGGKVKLWSDSGSISAASDSLINVSGVSSPDKTVSSDAGSLALLAPGGHVVLGTINGSAAAGQHGGSFTLDSQGSGAPFDVASLGLSSAGFTGGISIRDRADMAVVVSGSVRAESFELAADQGSITVAGTIDTSGNQMIASGGAISLWANNDLTLAQGSKLVSAAYAKAPADAIARGGDITLGSQTGAITLASGAMLDPRGKAQTSNNPGVDPDGQITLRAGYDAVNGTVRINPILATIEHTAPATLIVEGVRSYSSVSNVGDSGDLTTATLAADLQDFASHTAAITAALTPPNADFSVQVRPGIDISSSGDLTVGSVLDLNSLATNSSGGAPINLTLRAAGNLIVGASISDGFVSDGGASLPLWSLASGESGTLRLTAGADLSAANPLATVRGTGDFILTPGSLVRTGTGSILVAAGGNVCLGCNTDGTVVATAQTSVIYTAGQHSSNGPTFFTNPTYSTAADTPAEFPVDGGDIVIEAQGDITSAPTTNLVSNWLWRQGKLNSDGTFARNTAWFIDFAKFQQGVGALGGGDVAVSAGGDITNLSVVIPTTGRVGKTSATDSTPLASSLVVNGGGNLRVTTGGNILSGLYQDDLGTAVLQAEGSIQAASGRPAPLLALANTQFLLQARGDVTLDGLYNSTAIGQSKANSKAIDSTSTAYFYTYAPDTTLSVVSEGGSVLLNGDQAKVLIAANASTLLDTPYITAQTVSPPNLNVTALSGDVQTPSTLLLFPSATGSVNLLAQHDLLLPGSLTLFESDPALIGNPLRPGAVQKLAITDTAATLPLVPLHENDTQPARFVAATGSIVGSNDLLSIPKQAELIAGLDITDVGYFGKNLRPSDVTLFEAGRDVTYATTRNTDTNQLSTNSTGIDIQGPGFFEMLAGGQIDLGNAAGVVSSGNLQDVRLANTGATLLTGAGFGRNADGSLRNPAYDAFESTYIAPGAKGTTSDYQAALLAYMKQLFPDQVFTTVAQAYDSFGKLDRTQQLPFVNNILSDELNATGLDHTIKGTSYDRGYAAIATLFPTKDAAGNTVKYAGDINMSFSQIKTEQGGDIDILAPGGSVVVGVPNPPPALAATKEDDTFSPPLGAEASLGLLVLSTGGIHGFADSSFEVNQSRILTLQGGDIILWSSNGDIDAGKGAKTAQGAPPPVVQTDQRGVVVVNPIGAISGSGIGQLLTRPDIVAGQVNLIAPKGTVNAGEAGIRAINLNIAALQVLNVGNIKVSGTATGVPTSDAGAFAGALSGANGLSDAGKAVAEQLNQTLGTENNFQQLSDSLTPTFISVRMFCLGVQCTTN